MGVRHPLSVRHVPAGELVAADWELEAGPGAGMMLLLAASAALALTHSMYQANLGVWSWTLVIQRRRLLLPGGTSSLL